MRLERSAFVAVVVAAAAACMEEPLDNETLERATPELHIPAATTPDDPIEPLPLTIDVDARKVALGEKLFNDTILSPNGDLTCTTCHVLERGGEDGRKKSDLPDHAAAAVNTPTVFNVSLNFKYHWGGLFDELKLQLKIPIESPRVMATTYPAVVGRLKRSAEYRRLFAEIYPNGITETTFVDAMVEYERSLVTPNSKFDRYLRGEDAALDADERAGYALFKSHGCISCHQGINVGGNMFQKLGVMRDFFDDRGSIAEADLGRYNITKREEDKHVFRVPSLRNIAVTGPYFHDGSAETLEDAVQVMSEYQLGRPLSARQTELLVAFLKTLTGEYKGKLLL